MNIPATEEPVTTLATTRSTTSTRPSVGRRIAVVAAGARLARRAG